MAESLPMIITDVRQRSRYFTAMLRTQTQTQTQTQTHTLLLLEAFSNTETTTHSNKYNNNTESGLLLTG